MNRILLLVVAAAFLLSVSAAFGQATVPMYFNGGTQGNVWYGGPEGGVYTGFYDGSINNHNVGPGYSSPGMICDDYGDNIYSGEHWTAKAYHVSALNAGNIGSTLFGSDNGFGVAGYTQLAYLANLMFHTNAGNGAQLSSISQALWYLTSTALDGSAYTKSWNLDAGAQTLVSYVQNKNNNLPALSTYTGLWLYTQPFSPTGVQEMWGQIPGQVPEGGAALIYLLLAGVTCFGAIFYSRRQTAMGGSAR